MARIILAYSPLSDAATQDQGSFTAGLPRANLKTDKLSQVARTIDLTTTNTRVRIDFGSAVLPGALIAGPVNLSAAGLYRWLGSSSSSFGSGYTQAWTTLGLTAAQIDSERRHNIIHVPPAGTAAYRYWRLEIDDQTNPAGYIEIGRLFIDATPLAPTINYAEGSNGLSWEDRTRRKTTLGGVDNTGRNRNRRLFNFAIPMLPENEAFGTVYDFERTVGFDKLCFVIPDPDNTGLKLQARSFWGTVSQMDPITQAEAIDMAGIGLTIREQF